MLAPDDVEGRLGERQVERVGVDDGDAVAEAGGVVQPLGDLAVLGGQIHRDDVGAEVVGDQARRTGKAGSEVEYPLAGRDSGEPGEGERGGAAKEVELVELGEVDRLETLGALARGLKGALDPVVRRSPRLYWASTARAVAMSFSSCVTCLKQLTIPESLA